MLRQSSFGGKGGGAGPTLLPSGFATAIPMGIHVNITCVLTTSCCTLSRRDAIFLQGTSESRCENANSIIWSVDK